LMAAVRTLGHRERHNRPSRLQERRARPRRSGYLRLCSISLVKIISKAYRERPVS
jgi:hypothetical protein